MKTVIKPWGKEVWLELNEKYCYKRIYIDAGYKTSYQYHEKKRETNYIIDGTAEVWLENDNGIVEKKIMKAGDYFNVTPPKKHRVIALTDIILQEVSTPEVDDVIRIEDDTNRKDGKIDGEHSKPAVLILAAGLGSRLKKNTKSKNKALVPINNKAIISHIIEKFPHSYDIVIAVGYKKQSLIEYCNIAHSDRNINFIQVDKWEDSNVGPGYTALKCKEHLQRPFYIITADCLVDGDIPKLDGNWLAVHPTAYPEKYSTIKVDENSNIIELVNKSENGFDNAFIGLAAIWDYSIFWKQLALNTNNSELVSAWYSPKSYPSLKSKSVKWFDTGNLDDIEKAKEHFKDKPLSLHKEIDEITYKIANKFLKFNSDANIIKNRTLRANAMGNLIPTEFYGTTNFISYNWEEGITLYEYNSINIYNKFLSFLDNVIKNSKTWTNPDLIKPFYVDKTRSRIDLFITKYGNSYFDNEFEINGKVYPSLKSILEKIDFNFESNLFYNSFHGDLQFDNIIYNSILEKFTYIDWRESFAGNTEGGDLYYDLSKLYGGCILAYNILKDEESITFTEGVSTIKYSHNTSHQLTEFIKIYENWLINNNYDLNKVKLITGLIYLNMSPLHTNKFNKMLWFKSIEILYESVNK
jgi:NDP-sugar pyrophosphorylase family protein/mannose-6-phosphate isomerase-like protein (cupin superfamily)